MPSPPALSGCWWGPHPPMGHLSILRAVCWWRARGRCWGDLAPGAGGKGGCGERGWGPGLPRDRRPARPALAVTLSALLSLLYKLLTKKRRGESLSRHPTPKTHAGYGELVKKAHGQTPCTRELPELGTHGLRRLAGPCLILLLQCQNTFLKKQEWDHATRVRHQLLFPCSLRSSSGGGRRGPAWPPPGTAKGLAAGAVPRRRLP